MMSASRGVTPQIGRKTPGHEYPESYQPGLDPVMDEIWEALDHIKPGVIPPDVRDWIAGYWRGHVLRVLTREKIARSQ